MHEMKKNALLILVCVFSLSAHCGPIAQGGTKSDVPKVDKPKVVVMVWDGLRPDSISPLETPNLYELSRSGVNFKDHHSTYPTFTMMNAASLATGAFPRQSGFYGNTFWTPPPQPTGKDAFGKEQSFVNPVFTEDHAILQTLDTHYQDELILIQTMFDAARKAGLVTASVGKSGPAFLQDMKTKGFFIDENTALPLSFAKELQNAHIPLPGQTKHAFEKGVLEINDADASPTKRDPYLTFPLSNYGETVYSRDASDLTKGALEEQSNKYLMSVFTHFILPKKNPDLSLIWFRTPDNSEHGYGIGSPNYHRALRSMDERLGELKAALKDLNLEQTTNIVVVSDHGHSSVSGPTQLFPLRSIKAATQINNSVTNAQIGETDSINGYSFSGDVRSADLLTYAGFKAYDGKGCLTSAMAGIAADMSTVYQAKIDTTGQLCGAPNTPYMAISATLDSPVASFKVPSELPEHAIIVAANGGSDYFYVPDHDQNTVELMVRFLQSREEYGAIFVDSRYAELPGTFALDMINLENTNRRDHGQPDVVASFDWDQNQRIQGMPGIEFESFGGQRGMHGSFSPVDVHNTLIASGPAFLTGRTVSNPSGNVDVAPTIAYVLGLEMTSAAGRILNESLKKPSSQLPIKVRFNIMTPTHSAENLKFKSPLDLTGHTLNLKHSKGIYSANLVYKDLTIGDKTYRYLDYAKALRY
jgi:predicted AlkP superfamily pyrophosphatase or phosphodiesterase